MSVKPRKQRRPIGLAASSEWDPFRAHWLRLTPGQRLIRSWRMRGRLKDSAAIHDANSLPRL